MNDISEYKEMYAVEAAEHLQSMNDALLSLEKDPDNSETINVMFRAAHTLKGMSATMGYSSIAELTHNMENLMDRVRKNEMTLGPPAIDVLFEIVDTLEKMVEMPEDSSRYDISSLLERITQFLKAGVELPDEEQYVALEHHDADRTAGMSEKECNVFNITITLHESCILKSARSAVILRNLSELGEIIETSPTLKDIDDGKFDRVFSATVSTKEDSKKLEDIVKATLEISKVDIKPMGTDEIQTKKIEDDRNYSNDTARSAIKNVQSVRVGIERLDSLMNLVGELVINKIRLMQLAADHKLDYLEDTLASLNRLTNDLQEEIIATRMVPIEQIFNRFPRMVRDLAKKEGKEVELIMGGGDIELDRTVLDEVGDPLVHLLRNCVDHGIESPLEREKSGKNLRGRIKLTARREKNYVIIEADDDGRGMDPGRLRRAAVTKGLMTQEEASRLTDSDALNLSFMPGFSTAERVTDISGRGVGMDVVRTKMEALGGSIKLESRMGEGTKIVLKLPLTVAIIRSLMIKVGKETYAIPITNVVRDLAIKKDMIRTIKGEEVVLTMGEVLPIIRLHTLFGINSNGSDDMIVVVVERGGSNVGIVVDQVIGQQEVIIKKLDNRILKGIKGFAGATILGDGNVALILDVGTLL
ncbi:chemotaxis protein histidine kinase-like protein [Candidatus Methanoperedens nitroreducens]|uniref:Chemotaxis protein CheA n=1 Tax=Candidatus Methanoperedens nitratireducens TaxID=1392998 RepID=A0A062V3D5_9EURY|nr:chemotaxis protein CheA [Candidatus Methanoperedens nitroreducens]KCZ71128.1 chemotaxis protein histidine kinase-like protein [Candidatus Methanoperedens nitroreducens]MDJ1421494.1 chemotaxis protein CheA [Candidatus Methanoperedens sp.]